MRPLLALIVASCLWALLWALFVTLYARGKRSSWRAPSALAAGAIAALGYAVGGPWNPISNHPFASAFTFLFGGFVLLIGPGIMLIRSGKPERDEAAEAQRQQTLKWMTTIAFVAALLCALAASCAIPAGLSTAVQLAVAALALAVQVLAVAIIYLLLPKPVDPIESMMKGSRVARDRQGESSETIVARIDVLLAEKAGSGDDTLKSSEAYGLVSILCERRDRNLIPHLMRFAKSEKYPTLLRPLVLEALGTMGAREQIDFITEFTNAAHPATVREAAASALAMLSDDKKAASNLLSLLTSRAPDNSSELFWKLAEQNEGEAKRYFADLSSSEAAELLERVPREFSNRTFLNAIYGEQVKFSGKQLSSLTTERVIGLCIGSEYATPGQEVLPSSRVAELRSVAGQVAAERARAELAPALDPSNELWRLTYEALQWARKNPKLTVELIAELPTSTDPTVLARRLAVLAHIGERSGLSALYEMASSASEAHRAAAARAMRELTEYLTHTPKSSLPPPTPQQVEVLQRLIAEQSAQIRGDAARICDVLGVEMPVTSLYALMTDPSVERPTDYCEFVAKADLDGKYLETIHQMLKPEHSRYQVIGALWLYLRSPAATVRQRAIAYLEQYFAQDEQSEAVKKKHKAADKYDQCVVRVFEDVGAVEAVPLLEDIVRNASDSTTVWSGLTHLVKIAPERALEACAGKEAAWGAESELPRLYLVDHSGEFTNRLLASIDQNRGPNEELVDFLLRHGRVEHRRKVMELMQGAKVPRRTKMVAAWALKQLNAADALNALGFTDSERLLDLARENDYCSEIDAMRFLDALEAANVLVGVDTSKTREIPPPHEELLNDLFRCTRGAIVPDRIQQVFSASLFDQSIWSVEVLVREKLYAFHFCASSSYLEITNSFSLVDSALRDAGVQERFVSLEGGEEYIFGSRELVERLALEYFVPVVDEKLNAQQDAQFKTLFV